MQNRDIVPPLPDMPEGTDRDATVIVTLEVVSTSKDSWHVRRKWSEKRSVKVPRDYAVRRRGNQWDARFEIPVWLYRRIREQL